MKTERQGLEGIEMSEHNGLPPPTDERGGLAHRFDCLYKTGS